VALVDALDEHSLEYSLHAESANRTKTLDVPQDHPTFQNQTEALFSSQNFVFLLL
jgi:hypothetical protein